MFRWLLSIAMLVLANGCRSTGEDDSAQVDPENDKPRVALIMKSLANEFFSTMAEGAQAHQDVNSDQYLLEVNGISDERDLSRQVALVSEMVAAGVDAIVIAPADSKALVPALRKAKQAGVVIVNIDNRLDADVLKQEGIDVPFVGPDNRAGARKVGEFLATQLSKGDGVAILEGIRGTYNAQQRRLGFEDAMRSAGMKIVDSQSAECEMSPANTVASAMLSEHPEIRAILAANDNMAMGAVAAVNAAGRGDQVKIIGFDNTTAAQDAIRQGKLLATADQYGGQLAVFGIEYALKLIEDPEATVEDRETPVDLVTADEL